MLRLKPPGTVRRFEVIDGAAGRSRWSANDRARILEETLVPGAVVAVTSGNQLAGRPIPRVAKARHRPADRDERCLLRLIA